MDDFLSHVVDMSDDVKVAPVDVTEMTVSKRSGLFLSVLMCVGVF